MHQRSGWLRISFLSSTTMNSWTLTSKGYHSRNAGPGKGTIWKKVGPKPCFSWLVRALPQRSSWTLDPSFLSTTSAPRSLQPFPSQVPIRGYLPSVLRILESCGQWPPRAGSEFSKLSKCLNRTRYALTKWGKEKVQDIFARALDLESEVQALQLKEALHQAEKLQLSSCSSALSSLLSQQECYWRQRSSTNWLSHKVTRILNSSICQPLREGGKRRSSQFNSRRRWKCPWQWR